MVRPIHYKSMLETLQVLTLLQLVQLKVQVQVCLTIFQYSSILALQLLFLNNHSPPFPDHFKTEPRFLQRSFSEVTMLSLENKSCAENVKWIDHT